jgi:hypothetical protein
MIVFMSRCKENYKDGESTPGYPVCLCIVESLSAFCLRSPSPTSATDSPWEVWPTFKKPHGSQNDIVRLPYLAAVIWRDVQH